MLRIHSFNIFTIKTPRNREDTETCTLNYYVVYEYKTLVA